MADLDEYSRWVEEAWFSTGSTEMTERDFTIMGFGLAGEAGEVVEVLKKRIRDGEFDTNKLKLELGDLIFYWVKICNSFGLSPTEVINSNIEKVEGRKARGTLRGSGNDR